MHKLHYYCNSSKNERECNSNSKENEKECVPKGGESEGVFVGLSFNIHKSEYCRK